MAFKGLIVDEFFLHPRKFFLHLHTQYKNTNMPLNKNYKDKNILHLNERWIYKTKIPFTLMRDGSIRGASVSFVLSKSLIKPLNKS